MEPLIVIIISVLGIAMLFLAAILRLIEFSQPESAESEATRGILRRTSLILFIIAMFTSLAMFFFGVIFLFMIVLFVETNVRTAGLRQRAWQAELLWILAIAVKSGRPLADEIESFARGTWGRQRKKLIEMAIRLRHGESLEQVNQKLQLLPPSAVMQIYAGISAKSLQDSLGVNAIRLTQELADDQEAGFLGAALMYPVALFTFMCLINGFIMYYIIPKFKKIFDDFGTELPQATILLIRCSDALVNYWYLWGIPMILAPLSVVLFVSYADYYGWRHVLRIVFGRWFVRLYTPDVLRSLSLSVAKGLPINEALIPMVESASPANVGRSLFRASQAMDEGTPCWQSLHHTGFIDDREVNLLEAAQHTGNLPWVLNTIAETIENRRMFRFRALLEFVQPMALIGVAVIVGFVVISLFLPLVKLLNDLS